MSGLSEADFTSADAVLQLGVEPCRVYIPTGVDGLRFDEARAGSVAVVVDDIELRILSKADLLKNKLSSGRDKDQGDIAWLKKNQDRES